MHACPTEESKLDTESTRPNLTMGMGTVCFQRCRLLHSGSSSLGACVKCMGCASDPTYRAPPSKGIPSHIAVATRVVMHIGAACAAS
ncbi:hypothetical protein K466DRAFT_161325 [Polyporus arcularius HHB13444]|uniref:Uncharacterized protein n=1 Tax=Polyporus arcularius HHB13444 TaxID=1314778 RepID=A0A5C3PUI2_9APHY|nr:hypothetical protein K466DRAFT_161325 [Polyporus arcularius HHB13444]